MEEQAEICPPVSPLMEPITQTDSEVLLVDEVDTEIDPESVVEAAEMLLRAGAPHDYDVIVIGAGPGGLACATHLAQNGQKVALVEQDAIGGTCLNRGCTSTKALLESVRALHTLRQSHLLGIETQGKFTPNLRQMQSRKREIVSRLKIRAQQDAEATGVQFLQGTASLEGDRTIQIATHDGEVHRLSAVHIVLATGGTALELPVEGATLPGVLYSDQILELEEIPSRLIVLGGGPIGVEFATFFGELGTRVVVIEQKTVLLPGEDPDIQNEIKLSLETLGIEVLTDTTVGQITEQNNCLQLQCGANGTPCILETEIVLVAIGRRPNINALNLEKAGVTVTKGLIDVDEDCSTSTTGVWAIGDCIRRVGWAHQAAAEGRRVADAILGFQSPSQLQYIPTCYYTIPEIASVGLTLQEAESQGIAAHVGKCNFSHNERATISGEPSGFVKLVVETGTGKLLGAQIIGPQATELINEIALALGQGANVVQLANTPHTHPSFGGILVEAARDALRHSF